MPLDVALRCVRREIEYSLKSGYEELLVTFMGGEPFLNFSVVKGVVDWLSKNKVSGLKVYAFATTNGTLLTPEIKSWLLSNRSLFRVSVSYDGLPQMQAQNRTSVNVDLGFFISEFPVQVVHMTVSRATLGNLAKGVEWLLERHARVSLTLAYGQNWTNEDALEYEQQLRRIAVLFRGAFCDIEPIPQLTMKVVGRGHLKSIVWKVGRHKVTYDVNGVRYPNYVLAPYVIGRERAIAMAEDEFSWQTNIEVCDISCSGCPLEEVCPTCPEFNYLYQGSFDRKDHSVCRMMFAQAKVALEFQMETYFTTQREGGD